MADVWCEECGALMRRRNGRYGEFWGCTGYPRCVNTKRLNDVEEELDFSDRLDNLGRDDGEADD